MIHHGDCIAVMSEWDADSIDAIVTDPPYGLEFMGKAWDRLGDVGTTSHAGADQGGDLSTPYHRARTVFNGSSNRKCGVCRKWEWDHLERKCVCAAPEFPNVKAHQARIMQDWHEAWAREAFRVAKPGAHLLAFGGTRTYHRLAAAIEDAGWEIRDTLVWAYASGFPKSHNLTGEREGWGTALKPAWEPIVMARKPLRGTVAGNVTEYGTGALNIDGCRIGTSGADEEARAATWSAWDKSLKASTVGAEGQGSWTPEDNRRGRGMGEMPSGRWPANVILTDPIFDGDTPGVVGGGRDLSQTATYRNDSVNGGMYAPGDRAAGTTVGYGDSGTYSRFFLIPKAARTDREPVLGGLPMTSGGTLSGGEYVSEGRTAPKNGTSLRANVHPTVKPTDLMRHLVRLVTPPGGVVLDPFLGSGSTGLAAEMEGFEWVGIEREAEYVAIAEARLNGTQRGLGLAV